MNRDELIEQMVEKYRDKLVEIMEDGKLDAEGEKRLGSARFDEIRDQVIATEVNERQWELETGEWIDTETAHDALIDALLEKKQEELEEVVEQFTTKYRTELDAKTKAGELYQEGETRLGLEKFEEVRSEVIDIEIDNLRDELETGYWVDTETAVDELMEALLEKYQTELEALDDDELAKEAGAETEEDAA